MRRRSRCRTRTDSVAKVSPSRWRRQPVNTPRDLAEACREAPQSLQNTHWRRLTEWLNAWQPVVAKQVASHSEGDSAKPSRVMPGIVERSGCARLVQHGPSKGATAQYRGTMVVVARVVVARVVVASGGCGGGVEAGRRPCESCLAVVTQSKGRLHSSESRSRSSATRSVSVYYALPKSKLSANNSVANGARLARRLARS